MWGQIDSLLERAPADSALRLHRVELLEARRRRAAGIRPGPELEADETRARAADLAVAPLLARVRTACDASLLVVKGPEVAVDYPKPWLRPFHDLDLLTDDAAGVQAALLAAGFREVGDPALFEGIHHLRPLWWPGLPLTIELHSRPKWPAELGGPAVAELLESAVPARVGVPGISTLPPAHHAVLLAAHAWAHEPLARLGQLIDVAATVARAAPGEAAALARRWGCLRMWRTTERAARALIHGDVRALSVALWARHLPAVRERTVFESHLHEWLAPVAGLPARRAPAAVLRAVLDAGRRGTDETWRMKLARTRVALRNAATARSEHGLSLEQRHTTAARTTR